MKIEKAHKGDLKDIVDVVHDSIINLCQKDHLNKQEHIHAWLAERSVQKLENILFSQDSRAFVCTDNGHIVGVSHIDNTGVLTLCYVHSRHIGKGIGRLLLEATEQQAKAWGLDQVSMISTNTARDFYLSQGYQHNGEPILCIGMPGYPLTKKIQ